MGFQLFERLVTVPREYEAEFLLPNLLAKPLPNKNLDIRFVVHKQNFKHGFRFSAGAL